MVGGRGVRLRSEGNLKAPSPVITGPYPAFPTDAQPLMLAACLKARGTSVFVENVFQNRFRYTEELMRLGARIHTEAASRSSLVSRNCTARPRWRRICAAARRS